MLNSAIKQPLTNVQLELLKSFSYQLTENELLEVRKLLANFFAERLVKEADQAWDAKGWSDEDVDKMLHTKMRKKKVS